MGGEAGRGGAVQTLVKKGLLNFFLANYFSQRRPRVSQSVNAGRPYRGKYCSASRGEQIIGGYPKAITFLNIPGSQFSGKYNARFMNKNQPVKK